MLVFTKQIDLKHHLNTIYSQKTVGYVPTMGALHAGHLSLMERSLAENFVTIVTIFVNPTQFNNASDLEKYPRTLESDCNKIHGLSQQIIVYAPSAADIYGESLASESFDFDGIDSLMEGKHRPGHFDGVGTVIKKLFEIVKPTNAYFGEKDFQQLQIIKKLVKKLNLQVQVVECPIFRENNGLAMSSRNERLSAEDREEARIIFDTLLRAKTMFATHSEAAVSQYVANVFNNNSRFRLEYFDIAIEDTLLPCAKKVDECIYRAFIAVFCGDVRLIDTIRL